MRAKLLKSAPAILTILLAAAPAEAGAEDRLEDVQVLKDIPYAGAHERQKLDLYLPARGGRLPLVIWIHGGAWKSGGKESCPALFLLRQGYAIASVNYRLSQHAVFPAQLEDLKAAARWLRASAARFRLDPRRFGAWGASAGGHLAALLGTTGGVKEFETGEHLEVSSGVQAVCDFYGPTDLLKMREMESAIDHEAADSPESLLIGAPIREKPEAAARANPIPYIRSAPPPPFLILHGEKDRIVPINQSRLLQQALEKAGSPVVYEVVQGAGHGFGGPEIERRVREFFDQRLKGEGPPRAPLPVVVTTDCGCDMDDQWALAQAALAPEIELRGVVTTHAPGLAAPAAETAARCAREVLERLPLQRRPEVIAGSSLPLAEKAKPFSNAGVEFLLRESSRPPPGERLVVLVLGAATDVASALLLDPGLAARIEVVAMGFSAWPDGGDPWNVKNDVKAWQVLIESGAPLAAGDAAVTARDLLLTREGARTLLGGHGRAGSYLAGLHAAWLDQHAELVEKTTGRREAWPVWDQVTVAHLLGLTRSEVRPRPRLADDLRFVHPGGDLRQTSITWITGIDAEALWRHFTSQLDRAAAQ